MKRLVTAIAVLTIVMVGGVVLAEENDPAKLEQYMWTLAKDKNWTELKKHFAPGYIMMDDTGMSDLSSSLKALKKMSLEVFSLTDFKVTRTGNTAVVTYNAKVAETIDGKRIQKQEAPRATVFVKTDKGWKSVFHANFNPISK